MIIPREIGVNAKTRKNSGDPGIVLETAYERYADGLYRYALMILADHGAAEDAVQLAFMKTLKLGKRIFKIRSLNDYLRTAVRNSCYEIIRKRQKQGDKLKEFSLRPLLENLDGDIGEQQRALVEKAIRKLPPDQREALHMRIYENKTFVQIGEVTKTSANTAASRYRYGIDKLREIFITEDRIKEEVL